MNEMYSFKRKVLRGVRVGLVAGLIMMVLLMIENKIEGLGLFYTPKMIAGTYLGVRALLGGLDIVLLGLFTHFLVAAFHGVVFTLLTDYIALGYEDFLSGFAYGACVWIIATFIGLPMLNSVMDQRVALSPGWWLMHHLVFGICLNFGPRAAKQPAATSADEYFEYLKSS